MRRTNTCGVAASRRSIEASWNRPPMKWVWPSAKPGATRPPRASITVVRPATYRASEALSPTARIVPPRIATPPGWGFPVERPVQTMPWVMSRSALGLHAAPEQTASSAAMEAPRGRVIRFPLALDDLGDGLQGGDRVRTGRHLG